LYLESGIKHPNLIVDPQTQEPYQKNGTPYYDLIEGPTYANKKNLPEDFIDTLLASYHGVMRERYIEGKWVGYEGLIYPTFDEVVHQPATQIEMLHYHNELVLRNKKMRYAAGYDYGMAAPNAFGLFFFDDLDRAHLATGFYDPELTTAQIENKIKSCLSFLSLPSRFPIHSDPQIFKRTPSNSGLVGESISNMLDRNGLGVNCVKGNNAFKTGYDKLTQYLEVVEGRPCPYTNRPRSPSLFVAQELDWWATEALDYYWTKTPDGEALDKPQAVRDHAMDMTRYAFTTAPELVSIRQHDPQHIPAYMLWHEVEDDEVANTRNVRYGYG
jgi:hypothetical protein